MELQACFDGAEVVHAATAYGISAQKSLLTGDFTGMDEQPEDALTA